MIIGGNDSDSQNKLTWYEKDPTRLTIEKRAMVTRFPGFELRKLDDDRLVWLGNLTTNSGEQYKIAVIYPDNFPNASPKVYPIEPTIEVIDVEGNSLRYQYPDGSLCLHYPGCTLETNATAATVVGITAAWFFSYEHWLCSGKANWPGTNAHSYENIETTTEDINLEKLKKRLKNGEEIGVDVTGKLCVPEEEIQPISPKTIVKPSRCFAGVPIRSFRDIQLIEAILHHKSIIQSCDYYFLFAVFLYTDQDQPLASYIRQHLHELHEMAGYE